MKHAAKRLARKILRTVHAPRPDPDINPDANLLYAHRCFDGRVERRYPVPAACAPDKAEGLADSIFQPPGFVTVEGAIFDLRKEGVYRFYRLPRLSEQRIVWHGEPDRLLSLLGYLWSYGLSDESMELAEMLNAARRRVLVAGCHNLSLLAVAVLAAAGIRARLVALASLGPWGGQDDGHTLVEVELPETGWILYDPSFNLCFVENGRRISLLEFVQSLRHGRAELERLPGNSGHAFFRVDDFDYGFWIDERRESNEILYEWFRRVAGVPLISHEGSYAFAVDELLYADRKRLSGRYRPMDCDVFMTRFYGVSGNS